jgi:acyl-CoA synthetase (NDP forming)
LAGAKAKDHLLLSEAMDLLKAYGFSVAEYRLAATKREAIEALNALTKPVVMKINYPHISHKSDKGALKLNLQSNVQVEKAFEELVRIGGTETQVVVQAMAAKGKEVILGGKRDQTFGPIVLFGLGGIFVEALKDVVWRVAPLSYEEARKTIGSIRGARILEGIRGEKPCDIEGLADLLVRLSRLLVDFPQIQEIDINPVLVFAEGEGALAVDARVILAGR